MDFLLEETSANSEEFEPLGVMPCERLPAGFPEAWRNLDFHVAVGLILTEFNCVYRAFFKEYAVSSLEAAVAAISTDAGNCLTYEFYVPGVVPAFSWDADWPLLRRGARPPYARAKVQGPEPWVWKADRCFFEIRRSPLSVWTGRPTLRVGGRTWDEATSTWSACARTMRRIYRNALASRR